MKRKFILRFLLSSGLLISITSCGQKSLPYFIDPTINTTVDENIKLTVFPAPGAMRSTETLNDSTYPENYDMGKNFGAITQASLSHDTIFITSYFMARKASFGCKVILTSDSCTIKYFSLADEGIFKININDKPSHLITLVCQTKKLTPFQKPKFKVGELIEGIADLTTNDFWSFNDRQNTKIKRILTGYFKTNLTQFQPDGKGLFKQIE